MNDAATIGQPPALPHPTNHRLPGASGAGPSPRLLGAFYLLLIGTKVAVAAILNAGRASLFEGRGYALALRASALLLLATGVALAIEGLQPIE